MVAKPKLKLSICFPLVNITPHVIQTLKNLDTGNNSEYIFDIILSFNGVKSVPIFEVPINLKKRIKILHSKKRMGAAYSRNKAATESTAEFVCFVDSDVILPVNFLDCWWENKFNNKTYYSARILPIDNTSIVSHFFTAVVLRKSTRNSITYIATATAWINRELFFRIGKFDEDFQDAAGEDSEFCIRVHKNNIKVEETNIHVYHDNPRTIKELTDRAERYATKGWLYHVKLSEYFGHAKPMRKTERQTLTKNAFIRKLHKTTIYFFKSIASLIKRFAKRSLSIIKKILNAITFNSIRKVKNYYSVISDGLKNATEQHDHYFTQFTLRRKFALIMLVFVWTFTYRSNMKKQEIGN
jgi:glycosyltransferase involved in cell wall biosynthesis